MTMWAALQTLSLATLGHLSAAHPRWHLGHGLAVLATAGLACPPALAWRAVRRRRNHGGGQQAALRTFQDGRRDTLTRLAGRAPFIEALATRLRTGTRAALLLVDIDGFAAVNAVHGHRAADEVLLAVADRLRGLSLAGQTLARMDGDRFAMLVTCTGGLDAAEAACLAALRALLAPVRCGAAMLACTVSIGVCRLPDQGPDPDAALRAAGAALRQVKQAGGNGWRLFDPDQEAARTAGARLGEELQDAVAGNRIVPYYQPIVDLETGRMVGLEVLARWLHPTRGVLLPEHFIPLAETMQLAGQITQLLMRRVIADARGWPAWLYFAFNVSPGQLRELIGMVRQPPVWPEGALDPARLEVEVTESALVDDLDVAREVIALLQAQGTRVVLDDFGVGTSNFLHLRELPFNRIKIDRSFIAALAPAALTPATLTPAALAPMDGAHDPRAEACVRAMVALGASLGIAMVAEGIESAAIEASVIRLGCRFGQGFFYAEPVASTDVQMLLRRLGGRPMPASRAAG